MFHCKSQLSEHIIPTLPCFFFFVFLCSTSAGFFVVLPWKPGKVSVTVFIGRVKFASGFPLDSWTFCFNMLKVQQMFCLPLLISWIGNKKRCPWWVCSLEAGFTVQYWQLQWICWSWKWKELLWRSHWQWQDWSCDWWVDAKPVGKQIKLLLEKPRKLLPLLGFLLCWISKVFCSCVSVGAWVSSCRMK